MISRNYKNYYTDNDGILPYSTARRHNLRNSAAPVADNLPLQDPIPMDQEILDFMNDRVNDDSDSSSERESLESIASSYCEHEENEENYVSSDDDELNDEHCFDWLSKQLYNSEDVTIGQAMYEIMKFFLENALTKRSLDKLISLLLFLLPKQNNFPRTKFKFLKLLFSLLPNHENLIIKHQICEECCHYLGIYSKTLEKKTCSQCNSENVRGIFLQFDLKKMFINAFENRNLNKLIDEYSNFYEEEHSISDATSGTEFQKIKQALKGKYDLFLLWNTDGASVSKSSKGQIWPIQVQILNIPLENRRSFQFLAGLYYSNVKKPNMDSFLKPFASTLKDIYNEGFNWFNKINNTLEHSIVVAPVATLDCPARATVQNIMQFNGAYGCSFCEHPGMTCTTGQGHTRIYPNLNYQPSLRTEEKMIMQAQQALNSNVEHVKGVKAVSMTAIIPCFNIATSFVPDYMHAVLAGVVTMLMNLWFDSKNNNEIFYIKKTARELIDDKIKDITPPDFISRTPRSLKYRQYYKASEIRYLLLCYFPVLLKNILPDVYYKHFLLLYYGIRILLQTKIHVNEVNTADYLLKLFIEQIESLYGKERYSYNVHQLSHLAESVRRWGPLWCWSTFPFEDGIRQLAKINHGPNKIDAEIMNTIKMLNAFYILREKVCRTDAECISQKVLGLTKKITITSQEHDALQRLIISNQIFVQNNCIAVYARAKINKEVFTSEIYGRQKKKNNSTVSWNENKKFGIIKYFIVAENGSIYALIREYAKIICEPVYINSHLRIDLSKTIMPVRLTYCLSCIALDKILKVLCFENCICLLPNLYEKKL